jgi:hypothetical protein
MSSITSSQFTFPSFPKTRSFGQFLTIYDYTKFLCCSRSSSATNLMLQLLRLAIIVDLFSLIPKISGYKQWIRLRAFHHSTTHPWSNPIIRHPSVAAAETHSRHARRERQKKNSKARKLKRKTTQRSSDCHVKIGAISEKVGQKETTITNKETITH